MKSLNELMMTIDIDDENGFDIISYKSFNTPRVGEEVNLNCLDGKTLQATVFQVIHMVTDTDHGKVCKSVSVSVEDIRFM